MDLLSTEESLANQHSAAQQSALSKDRSQCTTKDTKSHEGFTKSISFALCGSWFCGFQLRSARLWLKCPRTCLRYTRDMQRRGFWTLGVLVAISFAQSASSFPALEQWKSAILSGDSARVAQLYSISPPAQIDTGHGV